jgi:transposase
MHDPRHLEARPRRTPAVRRGGGLHPTHRGGWEDLPERFGKPNSVHRRFRRWAAQAIWDELFADGIPTDGFCQGSRQHV